MAAGDDSSASVATKTKAAALADEVFGTQSRVDEQQPKNNAAVKSSDHSNLPTSVGVDSDH